VLVLALELGVSVRVMELGLDLGLGLGPQLEKMWQRNAPVRKSQCTTCLEAFMWPTLKPKIA